MATSTFTPLVNYLLAIGPVESDAMLLGRFARSGDESAFAEIVRRHGPAILGMCRRILRDGHAAEDAFQATFLLLAKKADGLQQPERLAAWLYGVAYRTATKLRSRISRRQTREHPFDETAFAAPDHPDDEIGPELDAAIQQLPSKYRVPFVLCYLHGLTNAEAAARLGCPTNTVATRLSRARERLRCRLTKQGLTATVSASLIAATTRNAAALAAGAAGVSPEVLTLMEGVRNAMMWKKMKLIVATVAILTLTGFGAGRLMFRAGAQPPVPSESADRSENIPPFDPSAKPEPYRSTAPARSKNFVVSGATAEIREQIATAAEVHRNEIAKRWLAKELPDWSKPCTIQVTITNANSAGATAIDFAANPISYSMTLSGSLQRILSTSLPHEITHVVLAESVGQPIPRWADEGAAILSESESDRAQHDLMALKLLKDGRALRLTQLCPKRDYTPEAMVTYAQGYSVTRFLVERNNRALFLEFVKAGLKGEWDAAANRCYGFENVQELEYQWLEWMRKVNREVPPEMNLTFTYNGPSQSVPATPPPSPPQTDPLPSQPMPPQQTPQVYPPAVDVAATTAPADVPVGSTVVQAVIGKDGMVVCKFPKRTYYQPVTSYLPTINKGDEIRAVTSYIRKSIQEECSYPLNQLQITGTNGKPIAESDLVKRLEKETAAIFIKAGSVDPNLLPLLKEGTIIISTQVPVSPAPPVGPTQAVR